MRNYLRQRSIKQKQLQIIEDTYNKNDQLSRNRFLAAAFRYERVGVLYWGRFRVSVLFL